MHAALGAALIALLAAWGPARAQDSPAAPTGPRFDIQRYAVEGATLLSKQTIDAALRPYVGSKKDFGTVQAAVRALEKAYADAGYTAVQIILPEQELVDGRVLLRVRELKVGTVTVEGNKYFDEANVLRSLPSLRPGTPPNVDAIARNLRTANENPAKNTTALLRGGESDETVDVVARVADQKPLRSALSLDSTGTSSTGITRLGLSVQHANLFNRDHVLSGQYITSPQYPDRVTIIGTGYHIPLYGLGDSLDLAYVYSDVDSGLVATSAGIFGISGGGHFWSARYNFNLPRRGTWDQKFVVGFDWREYSSSVRSNGVGNSLVPDLSAHPVSIGYQVRNRTPQDDLSFFLSAHRNLPGGATGTSSAYNLPGARPGSNAAYLIWRYGGSYLRVLPRDWQFRVAASGQYTNDSLIAGEQFGLGGMDSVRGFVEREIANDRGVRSGLEFYTPEWSASAEQSLRSRGLVFFDYGYAARNRPLSGEVASETIASYGVGLRAYYRDQLSLRLDYAQVHLDGGLQRRSDMRLHGSVSLFF